MTAHQAFHRAGLVVGVVVDVQIGVTCPAIHDEVDELLKLAFLRFVVERPESGVIELARGRDRVVADQVFEA